MRVVYAKYIVKKAYYLNFGIVIVERLYYKGRYIQIFIYFYFIVMLNVKFGSCYR
jgi:hypothetical protein